MMETCSSCGKKMELPEVLEHEGIKISKAMFKWFSYDENIGSIFRYVKKEDGVVTLEKVSMDKCVAPENKNCVYKLPLTGSEASPKCPHCDGRGQLIVAAEENINDKCPYCDGSGTIS